MAANDLLPHLALVLHIIDTVPPAQWGKLEAKAFREARAAAQTAARVQAEA